MSVILISTFASIAILYAFWLLQDGREGRTDRRSAGMLKNLRIDPPALGR